MGVPAFFRWLSRKYPSIVVHAVEEKGPVDEEGNRTQPDCTQPNPNDVEFDNLYLDMNGIIHPCCHPENKPAPKNEDEMMVAIFEYIDRIFAICRPRKLLYMAIDGVAPRAKMNQQRSRRFRASQESESKHKELAKIRAELEANGATLPPEKPASEKFDSNCITPGTPFMFRLADCLRYYIHDRLNNDPAWRNLKVILSDANMPGEGEHKIMDYIRKQRGQPDHDPNTKHCLCGADADLIMLGLATHEPNFTIIREEFKPNQPRPCEICAQLGHEAKECTGAPREKQGKFDELEKVVATDVEFIFIRLTVLREYLSRELLLTGINFKYDFERALDDWIFMCFFVGNDFLPHLPSLEIREGAIDRLVRIYKDTIRKTGGYLATAGEVNLSRVQVIMQALGEAEDQIFKKRREDEERFKQRKKDERRRAKQGEDVWANAHRPNFLMGGQGTPYKPGEGMDIKYSRDGAAALRMGRTNEDAAADLRAMLYRDGENPASAKSGGSQDPATNKRKMEDGDDSEPEPEDDVKLWEDGWKSRYYANKFGVDEEDVKFRNSVANAYARGLCWVLRYYFQGCASWTWYYPYHYAPFASDFSNIGDLPNDFEKGTKPFRPFEQLMAVFPAGSCAHVPPTWRPLMYEPDSPIIDFYPTDFRIDLNGKKWAWMGVALLPFVDEKRLLSVLEPLYSDLTNEEMQRAEKGSDRLLVSKWHPAYDFLCSLYDDDESKAVTLVTKLTQGMLGTIKPDEFVVRPDHTVHSPVPEFCEDIKQNRAIMVKYEDPQYERGHVYPAVLLPGAQIPPATLKPEDLEQDHHGNFGGRGRGRGRGGGNGGSWRPQLGFTKDSGYRPNKDASAANRMLGSSLQGAESGNYRGASIPPPQNYNRFSSGGWSRESGSRGNHHQPPHRGNFNGGQHNRSSGPFNGPRHNHQNNPYSNPYNNPYNSRPVNPPSHTQNNPYNNNSNHPRQPHGSAFAQTSQQFGVGQTASNHNANKYGARNQHGQLSNRPPAQSNYQQYYTSQRKN